MHFFHFFSIHLFVGLYILMIHINTASSNLEFQKPGTLFILLIHKHPRERLIDKYIQCLLITVHMCEGFSSVLCINCKYLENKMAF